MTEFVVIPLIIIAVIFVERCMNRLHFYTFLIRHMFLIQIKLNEVKFNKAEGLR